MARASRLKVFRTPIGFHDAYVAAPSQKAALEAWGADKDLFGIGSAEVVVDPALIAEPLAHPGKVVKRLRASLDEHLAAPDHAQPRRNSGREAFTRRPVSRPQIKSRPSREQLDQAEAELATFEKQANIELAELKERELALRREREAMEERHRAAAAKLQRRVAAAAERYERELDAWRRTVG